ncbi:MULTISPECIES: serine/threonine-protein kinase [Streptomyces]|uniref:non-specific serine/threonine protein kinase n=1 Tax=Streptomyces siderophoricus TaxID=2802281 RepID=A0ABS1MWH0_9ACTN|nr:serine/threonine-protein kinase [Streptomyces sp. 9-7]MBL1092118.1 serine/threonine protein kinase [Streptomyces sp. 9-7]
MNGAPGERDRSRTTAPDSSGLRGRRIAEYLLQDEIGRGGMAVVYRAEDLRLGRTVAVKLLAPELARNDSFRQRFAHESRVAAAIDHPHIVPVFEAGETEGMLYIAMRYVQGKDLAALLAREGRLSLDTTCRIALQVASALDAAHAHDLVHRDVKPGNILIAEGTDSDRPEHAYLTDFGLTKKSLSLTGLTRVGQFVGTLDYVAPEQISGRPVDGRCDVYSLACVVFEMLTGAPPFRREDDMALLWAHMNAAPPLLTTLRQDLPQAVDPVFTRSLAKTPDDRYETCRGFVAALRAAGRTVPPPTKTSPPEGHQATQVDTGAVVAGSQAAGSDRRTPPPPPRWAAPVFRGRTH